MVYSDRVALAYSKIISKLVGTWFGDGWLGFAAFLLIALFGNVLNSERVRARALHGWRATLTRFGGLIKTGKSRTSRAVHRLRDLLKNPVLSPPRVTIPNDRRNIVSHPV